MLRTTDGYYRTERCEPLDQIVETIAAVTAEAQHDNLGEAGIWDLPLNGGRIGGERSILYPMLNPRQVVSLRVGVVRRRNHGHEQRRGKMVPISRSEIS